MLNRNKTSNWLVVSMLAASFFGFLDATYLTAHYYLGAIPPCAITTGCETVLTSHHNAVFGIPVALLGSIYYLFIFLLAVLALDTKRESIIRFAAFITPAGFLASVYFVYIQLFVLKEICSYCVISAFTATMLCILGIIIIQSSRSMTSFPNVHGKQ